MLPYKTAAMREAHLVERSRRKGRAEGPLVHRSRGVTSMASQRLGAEGGRGDDARAAEAAPLQ